MAETAVWVDAREILKRSRRFDLIFKVELAHAWASGTQDQTREAEEAYLETVRSRNGFRESDPPRSGPGAFIEAFRRTAASIRAKGYDPEAAAIPLDRDGEVLNGAHRLAACAAYGKECLVIYHGSKSSGGGSELAAFLAGRISPAVAAWGMRMYLKRYPDGFHAADYARAATSEEPFPDWRDRVNELRLHSLSWRLKGLGHRIKAVFRTGDSRARSLKHADECRHRASAPVRLAEYWEERNCPK